MLIMIRSVCVLVCVRVCVWCVLVPACMFVCVCGYVCVCVWAGCGGTPTATYFSPLQLEVTLVMTAVNGDNTDPIRVSSDRLEPPATNTHPSSLSSRPGASVRCVCVCERMNHMPCFVSLSLP